MRSGSGFAEWRDSGVLNVKLVLVDDSVAVQRSFGGLLELVPRVELIGCAEDVAGARSLIDASDPDLIVLDLELRHGEHGMDVLRHVTQQHPRTKVIVLSNFTGQRYRDELLAAGALECFDKSSQFLLARDWIAQRAALAMEPAAQGSARPS